MDTNYNDLWHSKFNLNSKHLFKCGWIFSSRSPHSRVYIKWLCQMDTRLRYIYHTQFIIAITKTKSFSSVATNIWNKLPCHLSSISPLPTFRKLKHHFPCVLWLVLSLAPMISRDSHQNIRLHTGIHNNNEMWKIVDSENSIFWKTTEIFKNFFCCLRSTSSRYDRIRQYLWK